MSAFISFLRLWISVLVFGFVCCTAVLVSFPLVYLLDSRRRSLHRIAVIWAKTVIKLNPSIKVSIEGKEFLPEPDEAVVYVANHLSLADIWILFLLDVQFRWMAKASLFQIPLLGWTMRAIGYVPIERERLLKAKQSLRECKTWLERDISVMLFPEGTRSPDGNIRTFRSGAFRLAQETKKRIVPITIRGTNELLKKGSCLPQKSHIRVKIHPPLPKEEVVTNGAMLASKVQKMISSFEETSSEKNVETKLNESI